MWPTSAILAITLAVQGGATLLLGWRLLASRRRFRALDDERASREADAADSMRRAGAAAKQARLDRDLAELRAEEAESRWNALWRAVPMATLDDAGRVVDASPAAAPLKGMLSGRALATGDVDVGSGRVVRVIRAGDVALLQDATPEKRAELEAAFQTRAFEDTSFEGVALVRNEKIVECNAAFARLCGQLPHQLAGTPLRAWLAPELGRANSLRTADGRSVAVEAIARATPGGTRVVHVRPAAAPAATGFNAAWP